MCNVVKLVPLTLPKLPFPRTCRNVKSLSPTFILSSLATWDCPWLLILELGNFNEDVLICGKGKETHKDILYLVSWSNSSCSFHNSWVCTWEWRLLSLPGSKPISANLLASSALFTPQLGATFCSQRMCTFILQPAHKLQMLFIHTAHWSICEILVRA